LQFPLLSLKRAEEEAVAEGWAAEAEVAALSAEEGWAAEAEVVASLAEEEVV
jgi:hypothetical protein